MLYDYRCKSCKRETEAYNRIAERRTHAPVCCGSQMDIFIKSAPYGYVGMEIFYRCPVTNQGVTSLKQRKEIMAREHLVDANDLVNTKTIQTKVQKHKEFQAWCKAEEDKQPKHIKEAVNKWAEASIK